MGRIWASQGGLSRNKVAVGESAAGSPPQIGTRRYVWPISCSIPPDRALQNHQGSQTSCWIVERRAGFDSREVSVVGIGFESLPLSVGDRYDLIRTTNRCTTPCKRGWEGSNVAQLTLLGNVMTPCVRAIQASTGPFRVTVNVPYNVATLPPDG